MGYAQTAEAEKKMKTRLDESGYKEEQKKKIYFRKNVLAHECAGTVKNDG